MSRWMESGGQICCGEKLSSVKKGTERQGSCSTCGNQRHPEGWHLTEDWKEWGTSHADPGAGPCEWREQQVLERLGASVTTAPRAGGAGRIGEATQSLVGPRGLWLFLCMTGSRRGFWAEERLTFWKDRYSCWVESTLQGLRAETARPVSKLLHIPDSESADRDKVTAAEAVRRGQILARSTLERLQDLPLNWLWGMRERQESRTTPRLLPWVAD